MSELNDETLMKDVGFKYPDHPHVFHNPKTFGEFKMLFDRMCHFNEIGDASGVFTCAMQLLPKPFLKEE